MSCVRHFDFRSEFFSSFFLSASLSLFSLAHRNRNHGISICIVKRTNRTTHPRSLTVARGDQNCGLPSSVDSILSTESSASIKFHMEKKIVDGIKTDCKNLREHWFVFCVTKIPFAKQWIIPSLQKTSIIYPACRKVEKSFAFDAIYFFNIS